jgi:hypothetical protein
VPACAVGRQRAARFRVEEQAAQESRVVAARRVGAAREVPRHQRAVERDQPLASERGVRIGEIREAAEDPRTLPRRAEGGQRQQTAAAGAAAGREDRADARIAPGALPLGASARVRAGQEEVALADVRAVLRPQSQAAQLP